MKKCKNNLHVYEEGLKCCPHCAKIYHSKWQIINKVRHKGYQIKTQYNITLPEKQKLYNRQNNKCLFFDFCGNAPNLLSVNIDHDHKCCPNIKSCGKCIRGLLCTSCNTFLGKIERHPGLIKSMLIYIKKYVTKV